MKTIDVTIKGVSPLLINRFKEQDEVPVTLKKGKKDYGSPRQQAEKTPYYDTKTKLLWMPSSWVTGAIMTVASDYKLTGTRKSVKSVAGGAVIPCEEKLYFKEKTKLKKIEVDSRPVVIQRARIMRHRARLEKWSVDVSLEIDDSILDTTMVGDILTDAGRRAGLGDFRPQRGGPFGKFQVVSFKVRGEKKAKKAKKLNS